MSLEPAVFGKTIRVKLDDKQFNDFAELLLGRDWLNIDRDKEIVVNINTKVWFFFNRELKEAIMEVAV